MPATTRLGLNKQPVGQNVNTWGGIVNEEVIELLDEAFGVQKLALAGNATLTSTNFVANQSRKGTLVFDPGTLSAAPTITLPARERTYKVVNRTSFALTFTVGGAGVTLPVGRSGDLICDGSALTLLEPVAAAAAVTQAIADQAAASATSAASAAGTATIRRDQAEAARDAAIAARDASQGFANNSATSATASANSAAASANSASQAAASASSVDGPTINSRLTTLEGGKLDKAGGTLTGALRLEPATLAANNGAADFSARSIFNMSMSAAMTLAVANLADGQSGQVFLTYTGGALSFLGVDRWAVSDAEVATAFTATAVGAAGLVANASYEFIFTRSVGITQGRVGRRS